MSSSLRILFSSFAGDGRYDEDMEGRPFQFSVRDLLWATACIGGALATGRFVIWAMRSHWHDPDRGLLVILALFTMGGLLGAFVGILGGKTGKGVAWGLLGVLVVGCLCPLF